MKDIRNAVVGDIVSLKDEQTLKGLFESGDTSLSIDLTIADVSIIKDFWSICTWKRLKFKESDIVLIVKNIERDSIFDVRVCFTPDTFQPGSRCDLGMDNWIGKLFESVNDERELETYEYRRSLYLSYEDGDIEYKIKGGVLYGQNEDNKFCSIVEWSTMQDCLNPEIILFEIGGDTSGYVDLYQGVNIFPEEYEVL